MTDRIDYNLIAHEYAQHRGIHPVVFAALLKRAAVTRSSKVLEVGCGTGNYISAIRSSTDCDCWGLEPSEEMLRRARNKIEPVNFVLSEAEALCVKPDLFDLLYSVDVIHHIVDRPAYFREAYRLLREGGSVCTVTDSEWIIRHREPLTTYFPDTAEADLARYPRISELQNLMREEGFENLSKKRVEWVSVLTDISPYRNRAFSSLHLISEESFNKGIRRMRDDLRQGPIRCVVRYLLVWGIKPIRS